MGCGLSSPAVAPPNRPEERQTALDLKLIAVVVDAKRRSTITKKKQSFNHLMLQFPKLRKGFKKVRELFKKIDVDNDKFVDWEEFHKRCDQVGLDPTSDALHEVFALADHDDQKKIDAASFVLVFTIVYLLDHRAGNSSILYPEIKEALDIIERAFVFFDSSADGNLERKEVALAMKSGTRVFGRKQTKSLSDRLFDELDWDGSGHVSFKEFLIGIERMVMEDDGEEDEEEDMNLDDLAEEGESLTPVQTFK